ncbi:MAG: hypothetical protein U0414_14000 [Polyangiaceae bacterium]
MTSEDEEEEDVDSGWDVGSAAAAPSSASAAALSPKARVGAATRPVATPAPPEARASASAATAPKLGEKRDLARTSPAVARASIGLRKPLSPVAERPSPPAPPVEDRVTPTPSADDAPPTVGRPMPPPRSRSNTPKVTNAVQKARALDEALSTAPPNAAPAAAPAKLVGRPPGGGMRIPVTPPQDRSTTPSVVPTANPEAKPPATALRFGDRAASVGITSSPEPTPMPGPRREALKLNRATQDFAVKMLSRDADRAERGKRPSGPPLDLHLPLELSLDEPLESIDLGRTRENTVAAPDISLDDDGAPSVEEAELAPDELAAVDELDDVLDGLIDSLPSGDLKLPQRTQSDAPRPTPVPQPTPVLAPARGGARPPSLKELELSLEIEAPSSAAQPPSLDPATTRGFQEDDPLLAPIRDRVAKGDFMGALMRAEGILQTEPDNIGATYFATMCQEKIRDLYFARLGSGEGIPHVQVGPDAIVALALDHRSGFLISLIDGIASIDDVLDMSGMPPIEALRLLLELKNEGVIGID